MDMVLFVVSGHKKIKNNYYQGYERSQSSYKAEFDTYEDTGY